MKTYKEKIAEIIEENIYFNVAIREEVIKNVKFFVNDICSVFIEEIEVLNKRIEKLENKKCGCNSTLR